MNEKGSRNRTRRSVERWTVFLLVVPFVFNIGCAAPAEEPLLADSTMIDIMLEFHLADARVQVTRSLPAGIRDSILQAYDVDSVSYARMIWYYAEHPEKYEQVYGQVLDRLNSERIPLGPPDDLLPPPDEAQMSGEDSPGTTPSEDVTLRTATRRGLMRSDTAR